MYQTLNSKKIGGKNHASSLQCQQGPIRREAFNFRLRLSLGTSNDIMLFIYFATSYNKLKTFGGIQLTEVSLDNSAQKRIENS